MGSNRAVLADLSTWQHRSDGVGECDPRIIGLNRELVLYLPDGR